MVRHTPVLLSEVLEALQLKPNTNIVDCTFGGGGHSQEILKRIAPNGKVFGIDCDPEALSSFQSERLILVHGNFRDLFTRIEENSFRPVHGVLFDLGASSHHFDTQGRGFSFLNEGPLDMRFDPGGKLTAAIIINTWPLHELVRIFREYGDERYAKAIAQKICTERRQQQFTTTAELATRIIPFYRKKSAIHPATRVFQALRIAVNDELKNLELALPQALEVLESHGRLAVITFHSGEDRIVKTFFRQEAKGCICPPSFPICQCGRNQRLRIITKKAIIPSEEEIVRNPRARSAQLRVAEKI